MSFMYIKDKEKIRTSKQKKDKCMKKNSPCPIKVLDKSLKSRQGSGSPPKSSQLFLRLFSTYSLIVKYSCASDGQ